MPLPPSAADETALAIAHIQAGLLHEAEQICQRILAARPENAVAWQLLGYLAHRAGRFNQAVDCTSRSLQIAPNSVAALNNLGLSLHALRKLDDALVKYRQALALNPGMAEG